MAYVATTPGRLPLAMATGRRKEAVARVRLVPGTGRFVVNDRDAAEYFCNRPTLMALIQRPLQVTGVTGVDVLATVEGGGISGQAGAVAHGLARCLVALDAQYRPALRAAGLLTRDPRMKERRKYGLKKARKAPQYSKR